VSLGCSSTPETDDAGSDSGGQDGTWDVSNDVAVSDGGSDASDAGIGTGGPSLCAGSSYRLCDGFEQSTIDLGLWAAPILNNATVKIDSTHVARGSSALYVHTGLGDAGDTPGTVGNLHTTHNFPFPNDDIWGRVFVYMAGQSPDMHTNMIEAVGDLPGDAGESHYRIGVSTNHVIRQLHSRGLCRPLVGDDAARSMGLLRVALRRMKWTPIFGPVGKFETGACSMNDRSRKHEERTYPSHG